MRNFRIDVFFQCAAMTFLIVMSFAFPSFADDESVSAQDVPGSSQTCQIVRKEIEAPQPEKLSCSFRSETDKKLESNMSDVQLSLVAEREVKVATIEIKKRLIQNAVDSFAQSVARMKQMFGSDPLAAKQVASYQAEMQKKCGDVNGGLKAEVDKLLDTAKKKTVPVSKNDEDFNRYTVAMFEYGRIDYLINENVIQGEEKNKLIQRRNRIAAYYPLAVKGASYGLRSRLDSELLPTFVDSKKAGPGDAWMDDYLFLNKDAPSEIKKGEPHPYQIAKKLKNRTLPAKIKAEISEEFSARLLEQMKSIGELCKADSCSTFNISHELTAQSLRRRQTIENVYKRSLPANEKPVADKMRYTGLQKQVCDCRLLEPQKLVSDELMMGMTVGTFGGLAFCIFLDPTKISCPIVAATAMTSTAAGVANTTLAVRDVARTESAMQASSNLGGLAEEEKAKLRNFQRERSADAAMDVGLAAGGTAALKTVAPYAKKAVSRFKKNNGTAVDHRGTGEVEDHVIGGRSPERQSYIDDYAHIEGAAPTEIAEFRRLEAQINADIAAGREPTSRVFTLANSMQKDLNTITNDFKVPDAINNNRNAIARKKLLAYMVQHPDLKMAFGPDWKTINVIPYGKIPATFDDDMKRIASEIKKELAEEVIARGAMRADDFRMLLDKMNHSGSGKTFDQASSARKLDRDMAQDRSVHEGRGGRDFNDPATLEAHKDRFTFAEQYRGEIEQKLGETPLMMTEPETGKKVLTREAYSILKTSEDPEVLQQAIKKSQNIDVDVVTVRKMKEYAKMINGQSPDLLPPIKRSTPSLANARNGGISSDTVGMSTINDEATGLGAARATDHMQSLNTIRDEEKNVTNWMNNYVNPQYRDIARKTTESKNIHISGDEKKIEMPKAPIKERVSAIFSGKPVNEDKLKAFVRAHAEDDPSLQRHTYVKPGVPKEMIDPLTEHGHTIQKYLMEYLKESGSLSTEKLKNMNGLMIMDTKKINQGGVDIIVGQKPGTPKLTADDQAEIQAGLKHAIDRFNLATNEKAVTKYKKGRLILADE